MADLKQAMIWLSQGKKVRQADWLTDCYNYLKNGKVYASGLYAVNLVESGDWEIHQSAEDKLESENKQLKEQVAFLQIQGECRLETIKRLEDQIQAGKVPKCNPFFPRY